jgi:hypothetical protein
VSHRPASDWSVVFVERLDNSINKRGSDVTVCRGTLVDNVVYSSTE